MSDIEQILSKCDNCKLNECDGCITYSDMKVIKEKIRELEEENRIFKNKNVLVNRYFKLKDNSIPKQKVKDILNEIQEEYNKLEEQFDCIWDKKSKDNYDRYKLQELSAMQQELGFILGKFEKLLGEGE